MEELYQMSPPEARTLLGTGNRESLDIINLVLQVCLDGTMKTHVMYRCNLNSKQVQDYLGLLDKFGLVERVDSPDNGRTVYRTTERGRRFIRSYAELLEIFDIYNKQEQP